MTSVNLNNLNNSLIGNAVMKIESQKAQSRKSASPVQSKPAKDEVEISTKKKKLQFWKTFLYTFLVLGAISDGVSGFPRLKSIYRHLKSPKVPTTKPTPQAKPVYYVWFNPNQLPS